MKRFIFQAGRTDILEDIIFNGKNLIVKDRFKVNHIVLKPCKKDKNSDMQVEKVEAMFHIPYHDKIKLFGVKFNSLTHIEEKTPIDFIESAIYKFGSESYMSLSLSESSINKKFNIQIFKRDTYQINNVKLPSKMNIGEIAQFLEVLNILKICYKIEGRKFEISHEQDPTLTLEDQVKAYYWALENKFFPCIYSSHTNEEDKKKTITLSESLFRYCKFEHKKPKREKHMCIEIEKCFIDPETKVNEDELNEIESYIKGIGIKIADRVWKVDYYGIEPVQHKLKEPEGNITIIDEL